MSQKTGTSVKTNQIVFNYGITITPQKMQQNSIYLDGACRGPSINNENRSYSFDHHEDCSRFSTISSAQQALIAIQLGLDPNGLTIHVNDLDADTSMALWILQNPEAVKDPKVRKAIDRIGFVDSHGPVMEPTKLHKALSRNPSVPQTLEMLEEDQAKVQAWYLDGDDALAEPWAPDRAPAFGVTPEGEIVTFPSVSGFSELYSQGCVAGIVEVPGPKGTTGYTVGKRSDFVSYSIKDFLDACNKLETGWGGGSTIGGAPRLSGGLRSSLKTSQVKEIFRKISKG